MPGLLHRESHDILADGAGALLPHRLRARDPHGPAGHPVAVRVRPAPRQVRVAVRHHAATAGDQRRGARPRPRGRDRHGAEHGVLFLGRGDRLLDAAPGAGEGKGEAVASLLLNAGLGREKTEGFRDRTAG